MKSTDAKIFKATWIESTDYATGSSINLQRYQAALKTMTKEQAAFQTWSGKQAAVHGFKNVVVEPLPNGIKATFIK